MAVARCPRTSTGAVCPLTAGSGNPLPTARSWGDGDPGMAPMATPAKDGDGWRSDLRTESHQRVTECNSSRVDSIVPGALRFQFWKAGAARSDETWSCRSAMASDALVPSRAAVRPPGALLHDSEGEAFLPGQLACAAFPSETQPSQRLPRAMASAPMPRGQAGRRSPSSRLLAIWTLWISDVPS